MKKMKDRIIEMVTTGGSVIIGLLLAIVVIVFLLAVIVVVVGVPAVVIMAFPYIFYKLLTLYDTHSWSITVLTLTMFTISFIVTNVTHAVVLKNNAVQKAMIYRYSNYYLIVMLILMMMAVLIIFLVYR